MPEATITTLKVTPVPLSDLKEIKGNREIDDVESLADTMKQLGLINAILVYEGTVIAGARRFRAAKMLKWNTIPAKVIPTNTPPEVIRELQLTENLQRDDLTPWEEAEQLARIEKSRPGRTLEDLSSHLGKSTTWVAQRRAINKLDPDLGAFLQANHFPLESLPLFARVSIETQKVMHKELKGEERYKSDDPPTMSQVHRWLAHYSHLLLAAPWDRADATLVKSAGSCNDCPKRSLAQGALFPEIEKNKDDRCLDAACWESKTVALIALSVSKIKSRGEKPLLIRNYGSVGKSIEKIAKNGCDIDYQHNYSVSDKPKDKYKEAVVISGSETGRTVYVRKGSDIVDNREKPKKPVDPTTGKPEEKTAKEKLKTLEQRRMCRAAELWRDALPELKVGFPIVVNIASVFGTEKRESHRSYKWTAYWKMKQAERERNLWEQIMPVMQNRCQRFLTVENDSMPLWIEICSQADEMLQHQVLKRCWAQAVVELPMSKGLAKVVSDDPGRKMPKIVK